MQTLEQKKQSLQEAIENLYVMFSSYKLRAPVEGCPCCVKSADVKRLVAKPLRDLQEDDLSLYSGKAMTTWGDEYDFKHFLPRILELLATGYSLGFGADVLRNKFGEAQWHLWPENEQMAVKHFLVEVWSYDLAGGKTGDSTESWFDNISQVVDDVTPFLRVWKDEFSIDSCRSLLHFVEGYGFWPRGSQVEKWLHSDELLQHFEQRFFESDEEEQSKIFSQIVDALTNYRYVAQIRRTDELSSEN